MSSHHDWGIEQEAWCGGTPDDDLCSVCNCPIGLGSCDGCCAVAASCEPQEDEPICPHCGKPIYDFSDLGCSRCDARHPAFGIEP